MKPFSPEFNAVVYAMAARVCPTGYDISERYAPSNLPDLIDLIERTNRICVSNENSAATIFGGPDFAEFNYAFRAWHDWTHYHIRAEFNLAGEARVALQQIADLAKVYGAAFGERYKPLILAEVIGQALYKECTGKFPVDQRAFDREFLFSMGDRDLCLLPDRAQHDNFNYDPPSNRPRAIPADYHATQDHVRGDYR